MLEFSHMCQTDEKWEPNWLWLFPLSFDSVIKAADFRFPPKLLRWKSEAGRYVHCAVCLWKLQVKVVTGGGSNPVHGVGCKANFSEGHFILSFWRVLIHRLY